MTIYKNIKEILKTLNIKFKEITHDESKSCDDSKKFRKKAWLEWIWSKNILFSCKKKFYLVTTIWDKSIKAKKFKKEFGSKDIRFAYENELLQIIGINKWSIPPFGYEDNKLPLYVDKEILEYDYFIFNPGIPTKSIQISSLDLIKIYDFIWNKVKFFTHKNDLFEMEND